MKKTKKLISLVLAVLMVLSSALCLAFAGNSIEIDMHYGPDGKTTGQYIYFYTYDAERSRANGGDVYSRDQYDAVEVIPENGFLPRKVNGFYSCIDTERDRNGNLDARIPLETPISSPVTAPAPQNTKTYDGKTVLVFKGWAQYEPSFDQSTNQYYVADNSNISYYNDRGELTKRVDEAKIYQANTLPDSKNDNPIYYIAIYGKQESEGSSTITFWGFIKSIFTRINALLDYFKTIFSINIFG